VTLAFSAGTIAALLCLACWATWLSRVPSAAATTSLGQYHTSELARRLRINIITDEASQTLGAWIGLAALAMLVKLTASTDDVVWLLPFIASEQKKRSVCIYMLCMQLVVGFSWGLSAGGETLFSIFMPKDGDTVQHQRHLSKVMDLTAAVLLTLYTFKLFWDWWKELRADDGDDGSSEPSDGSSEPSQIAAQDSTWEVAQLNRLRAVAQVSDGVIFSEGKSRKALAFVLPSVCTWEVSSRPALQEDVKSVCEDSQSQSECADLEAKGEVSGKPAQLANEVHRQLPNDDVGRARSSMCKLTITCFVMSLNNIAIFSSMLLSGTLSVCQLAIGNFLGSAVVVALCIGASLFSCVVWLVEKIPLWCIIGGFAAWIYFQYFVLD